MNAVQMVISLYMTLATLLATGWFRNLEKWHGDVVAMHLHWNRSLHLAAPQPPGMLARQEAQTEYEDVIARKPARSGWVVVLALLILLGSGVAVGWDHADWQWILRYLLAPIAGVWLIVLGAAIWTLRDARRRMRVVAQTLYPRPVQPQPQPQQFPAPPQI